jgi:hypothetical protein
MKSKASVLPLLLFGLALAPPAAATDVVVGSGQASSCTEAAFANAVTVVNSAGGTITFNCGGPATINLTSQKVFENPGNPTLVYTIDGGGNITLNGGGSARLILHTTGTLNVRRITLTGGLAQGADDNASGGALRSDSILGGTLPLNLTNVTFSNNATALTVPPSPPFSPFDYGGGAVFTRWGIVTVTNCTFSGNVAWNTSGGALHGRSSTINITGSTFNANSSNQGGFGGAIWVDGVTPIASGAGGTLQISATTFTGNSSRNQGGAIGFYLYPEQSESATLNTVSVIGNQVLDSSGTFLGTRAFGGGISGDRGDVTIVNSTVANNLVRSTASGGSGGGLSFTANGTVTIVNTTISGNRAEGTNENAIGGGLLVSGNTQPFQVTHATIAFNFASFTGGGIVSQANGTLRNTIVAGNDSAAFASPFQDQCTTQLTNGGGVLEFPANNPPCVGGSRIVADPRLGPLTANGGFSPTHLLQAGSPAIDAGACVVATDQRGVARPQGAACDLGAVEVGAPPPPSTNFFTLNPCRVVDTRLPGPTAGAPLVCGAEQVFTVTGGSCGVPVSAKAVAANVTVTEPSKQGNLNVYPASSFPPLTSVVNYIAGSTRANNAVIPLNGAGQIAVRCAPTGTTHVVIDVDGYFQ